MNELALFAGAGGGILGGHLLGWKTICAVEWEPYPASVLLARQNDGCLPPFPIWDDVQTFDGKPWRGRVDVISGGFPCQDISCAGKGAGIDGERSSMWGHMARIIGEVRPRQVLVENSPMLVGRGLARVLGDLAKMGYDAEWGIVGAVDAGAPHKRDRIWLVAECSDTNRDDGGSIEHPITSEICASDREANKHQSVDRDGIMGDIRTHEASKSPNKKGRPDAMGDERGILGATAASNSNGNMGDTHHDGLTAAEIGESFIEGGNGSKAGQKQAGQSEGSGKQHEELADTSVRRCKEQRKQREQIRDADKSCQDIGGAGGSTKSDVG